VVRAESINGRRLYRAELADEWLRGVNGGARPVLPRRDPMVSTASL
jgi:hypothetical protein